jgi:hypothetical protein
LTPIVYDELRRPADRYLRNEREAATPQPTALVHEVHLHLVAQTCPTGKPLAFPRRRPFGASILVDQARRKRSAKRASGGVKVPLEDVVTFVPGSERAIEALDDAELHSIGLWTCGREAEREPPRGRVEARRSITRQQLQVTVAMSCRPARSRRLAYGRVVLVPDAVTKSENLYRGFRELTGMTPTDFRRLSKNRAEAVLEFATLALVKHRRTHS